MTTIRACLPRIFCDAQFRGETKIHGFLKFGAFPSAALLHSASHRQALVFLPVKTHNDRIACYQRRQGAAIKIIRQDSPKFFIRERPAL
jgi:hypothetical protein